MPFTKKFLLGSMGSIGAISAGSGAFNRYINDESGLPVDKISEGQLIRNAGLFCGWWIGDGNECSIREGKKLNLILDSNKKEGFSPESNQLSGKIKVYRSGAGEYKRRLRFTIESGNIQLIRNEGESSQSITMQEFEGYEIDKRDGVWYLVRKDTVNRGKMRALGLPDTCSFPAANNNKSSNCQLKPQEVKRVKFDGGTVTAGVSASLTITKTKDTSIFGSEGYKFTFKPSHDLSISGSNVIKTNVPTDFKIKKSEGKLSLEKVWDLDKLLNKVGLECNNDNICTLKQGEKINVKQGTNNRKDGITALSTPGTIKLQKDQPNYREGFKFEIEGGDITFTGGKKEGSSNDVEKIWNEDTYEIIEDLEKYYFSRRSSGLEKKWSNLGIPDRCMSKKCKISFADLKKIKFHDKKEGSDLITDNKNPDISLEVITTNDAGYHMAMKIKIRVNNTTIKIPLNDSKHIVLWKGAEVDFKIREEQGSLSLEKGFDIDAFAKQLGLKGDCEDDLGCTIGNKINIESGGRYQKNASVKNEFKDKKIKYEIGQSGSVSKYKFTLPEEIELSSTPSGFRSNKLSSGDYIIKVKFYGTVKELYLSRKN